MNHNTPYSINQRPAAFRSLVVIACLAIGAVTGFARTYSVTDLGALPGKKESYSAGINNPGQVTGTATTADPADGAALRYSKTSRSPLEDLSAKFDGSISRGFAINDSAHVVGDSSFFDKTGSSRHAALFKNGSVADLGTLKDGGDFSRANGINAFGQVVGFAGPELDSENSRAFAWNASTGIFDIGPLGGAHAQAFAINDSGFVTGNSETAISRQEVATHAFLCHVSSSSKEAKPMKDLGTLGGTFSAGLAINGANHVVGYSTMNTDDNRVHAFFFNGRAMRDLGSLSGPRSGSETDQSVALAINKQDEVVGYSYIQSDRSASAIAPSVPVPQQVAFIHS